MARWPFRRPPQATAFLGLGSNLGDRLATLRGALEALDRHQDIAVTIVSAVYETEPDSGTRPQLDELDQGPFLNLVAGVTTTKRPRELLAAIQAIEAAYGRDRRREQRWGPRTLDIDLLLYDKEVIDEPGLVVPHPRLTERPFVLVPLAEVLPPGATLPDGVSLSRHLARLAPIRGVEFHVRLTEGPGTPADPLHRRPAGPFGGPPRLGQQHGGPGLGRPGAEPRQPTRHETHPP